MSGLKVTGGQPTTVSRQLSLYKIEEDSADKLVLRARKIGAVGGGIILTAMGLVMAVVTFVLVRGRSGVGEVIIAGLFSLLPLAGGIGLLRSGLRNRDRIIFDRRAGEVRFEKTKRDQSFALPFGEIERYELVFEDRSFSSHEVDIVFKFVILTKSGDEITVDEAFAAGQMTGLAAKAAALSGVPFDEHGTEGRPSISLPKRTEVRAKLPDGIKSETTGEGTVYRWRVLPDKPGLIIFFSVLAFIFLFLGLLGLFLIFGAVADWVGFLENQFKGYGDAGLVVVAIALLIVFFKTWRFFAAILFARCRLALSPAEIDYEIKLFGRAVWAKSFRLPPAEVVGLALKDVTRKGLELERRNGPPFYLELQRFSEADLMNIKKQFLRDLGRES